MLPSSCFGSALPELWLRLPKGPASPAAEPLLALGDVLPDDLLCKAADMLGHAWPSPSQLLRTSLSLSTANSMSDAARPSLLSPF